MFLAMKAPLTQGTEVALSLEAKGRAFPFAVAEVAWCRGRGERLPPGVGVRFVRFLHPRAAPLLEHLVGAQAPAAQKVPRGEPSLGWPALRPAPVLAALAAAGATIALGLAAYRHLRSDDTSAEPPAIQSRAPDVGTGAELDGPEGADTGAGAGEGFALHPGLEVASPPGAGPVEPAAAPGRAGAAAPQPIGGVPLGSGAVHRLLWEVGRDEVRIEPVLAPGATLARQFLLEEPPRLVLDVSGPEPRRSFSVSLADANLKRARVGALAGGTRVVIDLGAEPSSLLAEDGAAILSF